MTKLYTYRETYDTGFAPNPFQGVLTLANCKPAIRRTAEVGDWVAAFTANIVRNADKKILYQGKKEQKNLYGLAALQRN